MLYILNKSGVEAIRQLAVLGTEDASVLLISDAVFLSTEANLLHFDGLDIDTFYAANDAVQARFITPSPDVELVNYNEMAGLLEDHDKIVTL